MPISFTIYEEHELFVSTWVGDIADSDLQPSYKQLLDDDKYKPGFCEIADVRRANMAGVTGEGMRSLIDMITERLTGKTEEFKTAVIAPKDLSFGLARVYEGHSFGSPESVMVFREPSEALKWLGVVDFSLE